MGCLVEAAARRQLPLDKARTIDPAGFRYIPLSSPDYLKHPIRTAVGSSTSPSAVLRCQMPHGMMRDKVLLIGPDDQVPESARHRH